MLLVQKVFYALGLPVEHGPEIIHFGESLVCLHGFLRAFFGRPEVLCRCAHDHAATTPGDRTAPHPPFLVVAFVLAGFGAHETLLRAQSALGAQQAPDGHRSSVGKGPIRSRGFVVGTWLMVEQSDPMAPCLAIRPDRLPQHAFATIDRFVDDRLDVFARVKLVFRFFPMPWPVAACLNLACTGSTIRGKVDLWKREERRWQRVN